MFVYRLWTVGWRSSTWIYSKAVTSLYLYSLNLPPIPRDPICTASANLQTTSHGDEVFCSLHPSLKSCPRRKFFTYGYYDNLSCLLLLLAAAHEIQGPLLLLYFGSPAEPSLSPLHVIAGVIANPHQIVQLYEPQTISRVCLANQFDFLCPHLQPY